MLGKVTMKCLELIDVDLELCPYQILTSMSMSKKAWGLTKQKIVIQVNPHRLFNYTTMWAWTMAMHATSYDILIGGMVLYPLGITLDFWEEIMHITN